MSILTRFGISLERDLLQKFDRLITKKGYTNRSEAIRDLIREDLVRTSWVAGKEGVGTITLVYDHHQRELTGKLTDIQHDYHEDILSTQHIHLDHDNCLEVVIVSGRPARIDELTNRLRACRGVKHCSLSITSSGRNL